MGETGWTVKRVGEWLAAAGVIASLIFVAVEIHQNTEAVKGATIQSVAQQSMDLAMAGLDNSELREAMNSLAREEGTAEQRTLMTWFLMAKLRADENRFRQVELGILDDSTFGQLSTNTAYRLPYFREFWEAYGYTFSEDFREIVEREFLPLAEQYPLPDLERRGGDDGTR